MLSSPRFLTLEILNRIESTDAFADILLEETFKRHPLKDIDRGLITEMVYGVLRWRSRIDWVISLFSSTKPDRMEREILNILRLGAYQLLFLDKIPASATVNESVRLAKGKGQKKGNFVNAVLRAIDRGREEITYPDPRSFPVKHISIRYSHPEWFVSRLIDQMGFDETVRLCEANNEPPPVAIRINSTLISREELLLKLSEAGYKASFTTFSPAGLILKGAGNIVGIPGFKEGLFTIQDEASQLISFILNPLPGERVLDACAAPGGKATHMAEMMGDMGKVIALDINKNGVKKMDENIRRLGLKSVQTGMTDACKPLDFKEGEFDRILLDAPCSGTGVLRRHPEGKWQKKEENITALVNRQKGLIENVAGHLKPGGIMVYSVCSIMKEEGEGVVESFLSEHPEFTLEPSAPEIGEAGAQLLCNKGFFKVYSHTHGMDGFFAAKLKRKI